jgi:hypothetical protein
MMCMACPKNVGTDDAKPNQHHANLRELHSAQLCLSGFRASTPVVDHSLAFPLSCNAGGQYEASYRPPPALVQYPLPDCHKPPSEHSLAASGWIDLGLVPIYPGKHFKLCPLIYIPTCIDHLQCSMTRESLLVTMQELIRIHFAATQLPSVCRMVLNTLVLSNVVLMGLSPMRNIGSRLLRILHYIPPRHSGEDCVKSVNWTSWNLLGHFGSAFTLSSTSRSQYTIKSSLSTFRSLIFSRLHMRCLGQSAVCY